MDPSCKQRPREMRRNVRLLVLMRMMSASIALGMPVFNRLWENAGLSLGEALVLQGLFGLSLALFEVPTGYFADAVGRKHSLVAAMVLRTAGLGMYVFARNFSQLLVAELLGGLSFAFSSGADQALLYDSLKEAGEQARFQALWARVQRASLWTMAACAVAGGYVGALDTRLPLIIATLSSVAELLMAARLVEPERERREVVCRPIRELWEIGRQCLGRSARLRWLLLFPAFINTMLMVVVWLYQPYSEKAGLPKEYAGFMFAAFNLLAALMTTQVERISERLDEGQVALLSLGLVSASYGVMAATVSPIGLLAALLQQAVRGYNGVVFDSCLQHSIESERRATIGSLQSFLFRLLSGSVLIFAGMLLDKIGQQAILGSTALATVCLGLVLLLLRPKNTDRR